MDLARASYASDRGGFAEILAARRGVLDLRLMLARMKIERERARVALETSAALDFGPAAPTR